MPREAIINREHNTLSIESVIPKAESLINSRDGARATNIAHEEQLLAESIIKRAIKRA